MSKISPLSGIITSIKASKCVQNIENMKVILPNNKISAMSSISEQEARNLVREFGQELPYSGLRLPKYDANYYELSLQAADANTIAKIKIDAHGNVIKALKREEKALGNINEQYAIDIYTKKEHLVENSNNGVTYKCRQNAQGDVLEMSEKNADGHMFEIIQEPDGNIISKDTNSFSEYLRTGIKSFLVKENPNGTILKLKEDMGFLNKTVLEAADN